MMKDDRGRCKDNIMDRALLAHYQAGVYAIYDIIAINEVFFLHISKKHRIFATVSLKRWRYVIFQTAIIITNLVQ